MRAISLWQPWASLCFTPWKRHETRHWATFYRGPLAIQAAQKRVTDLEDDLLVLLQDEFGPDWSKKLPRGRMIGVVRLAGCYPTESLDVDAVEQLTGNWEPGRFAWRLEDARLFADPPEVKGRQGFFQWSEPALVEPAQATLI